jgi:FkbM family methyltransferase
MSYSLHGLDIKLQKYLNFDNGFFIEAGANNGVHQSNTFLFEQNNNWAGLLIEPNYENYKRCIEYRPKCIVERCALVSKDYPFDYIEGNFITHENFNGLSLMQGVTDEHIKDSSKIVKVPAKPIQTILDLHNITHVDFFSLDVEGYELEVLNGLNFDKISPNYILIETGSNEERIESIINYMLSKNYEVVDRLSINDFLFKLMLL